MDGLMWGAVVSSFVLMAAGGLVWWLAEGSCTRALTGGVGTVVGGVLSLIPLVVMRDQDAAMRLSFALMMVTVVWLLAWVLASGIRAQQLAREAAESTTEPFRAGAPQN